MMSDRPHESNPFEFAVSSERAYSSRADYQALLDDLRVKRASVSDEDVKTSCELAELYLLGRAGPEASDVGRALQIGRERNSTERNRVHALITAAWLLICIESDYERAHSIIQGTLEKLRWSVDNFSYALASKILGDCKLPMADHVGTEKGYLDALATFRRYGYSLLEATVLNNLGVLRKKSCEYDEALRWLRAAIQAFRKLGATTMLVHAHKNSGFVELRLGNWASAERHFKNAVQAFETISMPDRASRSDSTWCDLTMEKLLLFRRQFDRAETGASFSLAKLSHKGGDKRVLALAHEFLGELYTETLRYDKAREHLDTAYQITERILPESDVMTEVLRRQAQLDCATGNFDAARGAALRCMRLSTQIHDHYEWGAACRVLGDVHAASGAPRKAQSAYEGAIHRLKSIHETYECMRAQVALGRLFVSQENPDAEIHLLEARQSALKLELDMYRTQAELLLARSAAQQGEWDDARAHLSDAEQVYDTLQAIDQQIVGAALSDTREAIARAAVEAGLAGAEKLRTMCRVYEDVRFPMEEQQADLAYQVAQTVDARALYLVHRSGRGYAIPIAYNIARKEAKETVRRLDRNRSLPLLGVDRAPRAFTAPSGRMVLAVPARLAMELCEDCAGGDGAGAQVRGGSRRGGGAPHKGHSARSHCSGNGRAPVLCVEFDAHAPIGPREFEYLMTGAEALGRLADERAHAATREKDGASGAVAGVEGSARPTHPRGSFAEILTVDPEMIRLIHTAERAACTNVSVLVEGETGVGKELFARAIHAASGRSAGPFVAVNVGGMSETLIESELFGHVRGAYTDAVSDREGLVYGASGGTLFLDEIGEMSEALQVKLLRLLESGEYRRLGENKVRTVDLRVVSATNRNLKKEVERGSFRQDVFYRLSAVRLGVPPLRSRRGDVQLLLRHFLRDAAVWAGRPQARYQLDVKAVEALERYDWPGNVRELNNEVLRLVSLIGQDEMIRYAMLSDDIRAAVRGGRDGGLLEASVELYERQLILSALDRNDWNRLRTAEAIGIPRTTLVTKMKRLHIATQR